VKAVNIAGDSVYSQSLTVTVGIKPNAPTNLVINEILTASEIQVTWQDGAAITDNPPIIAYRVYLDDFSGNPPALIYDTGSGSLTNVFTVNGLTVGQTYSVTVTAVNQIGESSQSNLLTVHAGVAPS
jgi:hypothetical protein